MIELNKMFIERFNKTKSKENYKKIFEEFFPHLDRCKICGEPIYYYDSTFKYSNGILTPHKKSCLSTKKIFDVDYHLCVCEDCLTKQFPEYQTKNKSRVFNKLVNMTTYAYNIPKDVTDKWNGMYIGQTEPNFIRKYGEVDGKKRWKSYCDKQALTNTFEYKQEKYGWSREQFDEYNSSRAVTIENLVKKHGEVEGIKKWKKYCDRQAYTNTLDYFIEKYGEVEGRSKYNYVCEKKFFNCGYSDVSKELFDNLRPYFENNSLYYADKECFYYDDEYKKTYYLDFYIKELNIGIEFNGDMWHANPNKYKADDNPNPIEKDLTTQDIWEKDERKNNFLKTKLNKLIIIWESELYKNGMDAMVEFLIKEINGK